MKLFKFTILSLAIILFTACKNEKSNTEESKDTTETPEVLYIAKSEATSVNWTAYKTTEKTPVGGQFTTVNFDDKKGTTPEEALNGLEFSIPISSLFTKDETRDAKIKASFFGAMLDPELIGGTIKYVDGKYIASLTMNGVTNDLPLDVTITDERRVKMTTVMQLKDWNALEALASLNKVCFELHKGPDGVSKTWEEVAIEVSTYLRKE
ncbi:MAG: YceI family protein [Flavobacteriaceae bacterium]|nr:YceI family protein [Flavobacteriaceae bacterium]